MIESLASSFKVALDKPWKELPREVKDLLLYGSGDETMSIRWSEGGRTGTYRTSFEGIIPMLMRRFKETVSESMRKHYLRYFSDKPCSACKGERLRPESRAVTIGDVGETPGKSIVQVSRMTIEQAMQLISTLPLEGNDKVVASELLKEIGNRLRFLLDVGLGYLTLDRPGPSLSGGESQRIRLASQMGSELTGGDLHPGRAVDRPAPARQRPAAGNAQAAARFWATRSSSSSTTRRPCWRPTGWWTSAPARASWAARSSPRAPPREVMKNERSLTGAYWPDAAGSRSRPSAGAGNGKSVKLLGAAENNLKDVDVEIPLGCLVAVTGVSGAGKSTLVNRILYPALARAIYGSREAPGAYKALSGIEHLDTLNSTTNLYTVDCSGQRPYNTPRWSMGFGARHIFALGPIKLTPMVRTSYRSAQTIGFTFLPQQKIEGYWTSDAQFILLDRAERFEIAAYVHI